jgi:hypothetical protein
MAGGTMEEKIITPKRKNGRFVPGVSGNPAGHPPHVKNRANQIKLAFLEAFDRVGGLEELVRWINENRFNKREFFKMLLTILPKETEISGLEPDNVKVYIVNKNEPSIHDREKRAEERVDITAEARASFSEQK